MRMAGVHSLVERADAERRAELADRNPRPVQKIEAGHIAIVVTTLLRLRTALGCG